MSEWTPKVGDRVMVGEHGPYEVIGRVLSDHNYIQIEVSPQVLRSVCPEWLTPAPDPEPDEPTALGALVRDGNGDLYARDSEGMWASLHADEYGGYAWRHIPRPVTVVLADPAEMETLRERAEQESSRADDLAAQMETLRAERDELQGRIDRALEWANHVPNINYMRLILRGEQ